jgi:pyruvate/2-oxoglutarate dehydrogenase complex dihydrolipoamide dehydrogenase (E3) component
MNASATPDVVAVDVVVFGLGPGGEDLAGRLAEAGLQVAAIDGGLVGGECPYWGCIPSKMMIRGSNLLEEGRRIDGMAGSATIEPDWGPIAHRIREATDNWDDKVAVERLEKKGALVVKGMGRLDGPTRVLVEGTAYEASRAVVVATGQKPWTPPIPGLAGLDYWTNREAIEATEVPASLLILGGGAIGVELAQVFARFGSAVTIVEGAPRILALEEPESSKTVAEVFARENIEMITGAQITGASWSDGKFSLSIKGSEDVVGEKLLVATGRRPDLSAIGAASIGVDETGRLLPVNAQLEVVPGVYAIGDVTGLGAFTHMSMYHARIVRQHILGHPVEDAEHRAVPRVTFTDPEVGSVGMTEEQAKKAGIRTKTGFSELPKSARGWIHKVGNDGFIKLVADEDRSVLVGATSVGPMGGEVLGLLTLAVHGEVPIRTLRTMIYAYPTFHRAIEPALDDLDL